VLYVSLSVFELDGCLVVRGVVCFWCGFVLMTSRCLSSFVDGMVMHPSLVYVLFDAFCHFCLVLTRWACCEVLQVSWHPFNVQTQLGMRHIIHQRWTWHDASTKIPTRFWHSAFSLTLSKQMLICSLETSPPRHWNLQQSNVDPKLVC
jgi:hypothetical protein